MKVSLEESKTYWRVYYSIPRQGKRPLRVSQYVKKDPKAPKKSAKAAQDLRAKLEKDLNEEGINGQLSKADKVDFWSAKDLLKGFPGMTLTELAQSFTKGNTAFASPKIKEVLPLFLKTKANMDENTFNWYKSKLRPFARAIGHTRVDDLTPAMVAGHIEAKGNTATTDRADLRAIRAFYRFGLRQDPPWAAKDRLKHTGEHLRKPIKKPPGIFTPAQAHAFLHAIEPKWKACFAIQYFTGLRLEALCDTPGRAVNTARELISIEGAADKKHKERFLQGMPAALWAWLQEYPPAPNRPLCSSTSGHRCARNRALVKLRKNDASFTYPSNALRHGFGSYFLHIGGLSKTMLIMGHKGDPATFWDHYFYRSTEADAKEYFEVWPK